jgi:hypothetical protein
MMEFLLSDLYPETSNSQIWISYFFLIYLEDFMTRQFALTYFPDEYLLGLFSCGIMHSSPEMSVNRCNLRRIITQKSEDVDYTAE